MDKLASLSKKAREEYEKLAQKLNEIVSADRQREPKLTPQEVNEIATCQERIERMRPVTERLKDLIRSKEERLTVLERDNIQMIIDGSDPDALVAEQALLKPALNLLSDAFRVAATEGSMSEARIAQIKDLARTREIAQEPK